MYSIGTETIFCGLLVCFFGFGFWFLVSFEAEAHFLVQTNLRLAILLPETQVLKL